MLLIAAINWHSVFFLLFAVVTCVFALGVLFSSNIVRMAFYLVISLGATAGLFFLAGADFVAAMQLMIYVGGTLVLLIFGVMLTAKGPFITMKTRGGEWVIAAIVGGSLLAVLIQTAFSVPEWRSVSQEYVDQLENQTTAALIGAGNVGLRLDALSQPDETLRGGMSGYLLPFEIVSVHLLVVLVGAAFLARAKRRTRNTDDSPEGAR